MAAFSLVAACSAPPPPPPAAPLPDPTAMAPRVEPHMSKDPVSLGKPCATGEAVCGGGVCDLTVKNDCDAALTCDVFVSSSCRTSTEIGEARGRKRGTFAAKEVGKLNVPALCPDGNVVRTAVAEVKCQ
jgi:hypothetical protein